MGETVRAVLSIRESISDSPRFRHNNVEREPKSLKLKHKIGHDSRMDEAACELQLGDRNALLQLTKYYGRQKNLQEAKRLHAELKELIARDLHLGTSLLSMLGKCGALEEAREVFDELSDRDAVSWSALIAGYAHYGRADLVQRCFQQMQEQGLSPNVVTFLCVIKACGSTENIETGRRIHAQLQDQGLFQKQILLGTTLVDMYAKCGMLELAKDVFEGLSERSVVSWSVLIAGYVVHEHGDKAVECFMRMKNEGVLPNSVTYISILKACGIIGCLQIGEEIHKDVMTQGLLEKNVALGTALLDMYAKCGMLEKAREVFEQLPKRDVISWSALITGYTRRGDGDTALKCFRQMIDEGISPDAVTFICVLKACGNERYLEIGEEIHERIDEKGLLNEDVAVGNALIDMYIKCNMLNEALKVFEQLPKRDVVTWSTVIRGYSEHGCGDAALECFGQMKQEGIRPNSVTFMSVLKACGIVGSLELGEEIHAEMKDKGLLGKDIVMCTALVDMYVKCGLVVKAQKILEELPARDAASWNALIAGHSQMGQAERVFRLFEKMRAGGVMPEKVSFLILLTVCSHAGLVDEGQVVFDDMRSVYRSIPLEHYTCMIALFCRAGLFSKVGIFLSEVPNTYRLPLFTAILGACHNWKNVEIGRWAFEKLMELDVEYAAAYISMRNLYETGNTNGVNA